MKKSHLLGYNIGHKISLLAADIMAIMLAFFIATNVRVGLTPDYLGFEFISLTLIIIACIFIGNGYASDALARVPKLPFRTFFIVLVSALPSMLLIYLLGVERFSFLFGRGIYPVAIILVGVFSIINRLFINLYLFKHAKEKKNIIILGSTQCQEWLNKSLIEARLDINCLYYSSLALIKDINAAAIVITPNCELNEKEQQELVKRRLTGTPIFSLSDFIENFLFLVPVKEISDNWFIRSTGFTMLHNSVALRVKRIMDIITCLLLFLFTLPITLATAVLIKLRSPGPVFFSQTRVGMLGNEFKVYKFRTMRTDAEISGAQWASENDPRIIPGGHFLRKTRIDEIPQCWNILKGQMSFIGPRPERPEFTSTLNKEIPYYDLRHVVKPGLTGWAQVKYPYGASTEDSLRKLQFDLYYIKNYSLLLDLNIVLRTIKITLLRGGR